MLLSTQFTKPRCSQRTTLFTVSRHLRVTQSHYSLSFSSQVQISGYVDKECGDFLPWLRRKTGAEISTALSIEKSEWGRSLYASRIIRSGECILKIPFCGQIWPDNLVPEVKSLLGDGVENVAKLAMVILFERQTGQDSEWAPYINCLPQPGEMNNTIFWSEDELEMVRPSSVYQETINLKAQIARQCKKITMALDCFPEYYRKVTFKDFMHAYAVVGSRAWRSTKGVSLIQFADFLNHDGNADSIVLSDDDKQLSEVISDRDYAPGEQVLIRYGKFSNATLLLDFGFSLPYNIHDEVRLHFNIPHYDPLREMKQELWQRHGATVKDVNNLNPWDSFTIKEVRSNRGNGRGLPQSLRAFARVLCCTTNQELIDLGMEAAKGDGRLARRPLKSINKEIQAHKFLLSLLSAQIEEYNASIKSLGDVNFHSRGESFALRRKMAHDLLTGELGVLKSASAWLKNYCATVMSFDSCAWHH